MNYHFSIKRPVLIVLAGLAMAAITCGPLGPSATPTPSGSGLADFGDAPDGDRGMDTGYYAPTGGPFVFTFSSAGVGASFPTVGDDPVPGPYTLDVDEFYIGPMLGRATSADIPSLEDDVFDPNDPDGPPNLNNGKADCDKENGSHNPGSTGCNPVSPYSIGMNGRLSIVFGFPPLGIFTSSITVSDTVDVEGPAYWNLLIDLNQDGRWGQGEWVAQDVAVNLVPGTTQTVISSAFRFPTSGTPWGRLNFPFWARSMVTLDRMRDTFGTNWDGRGVEGGFSHGEVEDYFIEWRPIGQRFNAGGAGGPGGAGGAGGDGDGGDGGDGVLCGPEFMPSFSCPDEITPGTTMVCGFSVPIEELSIACLPDSQWGINFTEFGFLHAGDESVILCDGDDFDLTGGFDSDGHLRLDLSDAPEGGQILLSVPDDSECSGTGMVVVEPSFVIPSGLAARELDVFGAYLLDRVINSDKSNHHPHTNLPEQVEVTVTEGSINFEGEAPFVNVSGELNDDLTFFAQGRGTVAGFPDIAVTFEGQFSDGTLSGDYTMGAEGGLPTGEPIVYGLSGSKIEPSGESPAEVPATDDLPGGASETIDDFIEVFNQAFADGETDSLYQLLHPAVFEVYGEEACQTYLETVVENVIQLEQVAATYEGAWDWVIDGVTTPLDHIYTVSVNRTLLDQTDEVEIHLYMPGDDSVRWLTDCGEPLE